MKLTNRQVSDFFSRSNPLDPPYLVKTEQPREGYNAKALYGGLEFRKAKMLNCNPGIHPSVP